MNQFNMKSLGAAFSRRFLLPGLFLLMIGCDQQAVDSSNSALCEQTYIPISVIQGSDLQSVMLGQQVTVTGVVTHIEQQGFFLQSRTTDADDDPDTSEALWIQTSGPTEPGAVLAVSGEVSELPSEQPQENITALIDVNWEQCSQLTELPRQPVEHMDNPEALENMRLSIPSGWQAVDLYSLPGQRLRIASERLFVATQVVSPGAPASQLKQRNTQRSVSMDWSASETTLNSRLRAGDQLQSVTGIFDLRQRNPSILAETAPAVADAAKVPPVPNRDADRHLRVVSMNVQNLFNGDGKGGEFPTPRGAETEAEYQRQLAELTAAIDALAPDVLAVMELENDGYSETSTIAQLSKQLNQLAGQTWAYVRPVEQRLGDDVIAVGLMYRSDRVRTEGDSASISTRPFDGLSRVPLTQRFVASVGDISLLVSVNHFKSKGGCPDGNARNSDQGDGQGCWNEARERSSLVLSQWVKQLQQDWNEPNALIVGDLNSYRMEDPIRALIQAGWVDVAGQFLAPPYYSYRYFGEMGTLDYAFANQALIQHIEHADIWHINSDTAPNEVVPATSTGIARFSDHDPLIVDIRYQ